jgi:hypothetical protein
MGALPVYGKPPSVADPLITIDLHLSLDILGNLATQVPLDPEVRVDPASETADLFIGEIANSRICVETGFRTDAP